MIFGIALSLTACSNDDSATSSTASPNDSATKSPDLKAYDACELLKSKEIEVLFPGETITITTHDTEPANPLGMRRCFWEASQSDMKFVQLAISSDAQSKAMKVAEQFENNKHYIQNVKSISDIGDVAYYGGSGLKVGAGLHVLVKNKGVLLDIQVGLGRGNSDAQKHLEIETSIAKKVIERL